MDLKTNTPFNEQVSLPGSITTSGFRIIIGTTTTNFTPTITPPSFSTAAFDLNQDSVTIANVVLNVTNPQPFGIKGTAKSIQISSVTLNDATNKIYQSAVMVSTFAAIDNSKIEVGNVPALELKGSSSTVSFSTFTNNSTGRPAIDFVGVAGSTVNASYAADYFPSAGVSAVQFSGAFNNVFRNGQIFGRPLNNNVQAAVIFKPGSQKNQLINTRVDGQGGYGLAIKAGADRNVISQSTITSNGTVADLNGGANNVIAASVLTNGGAGNAVILGSGASNVTLYGNTINSTNLGLSVDGTGHQIVQDTIGGQLNFNSGAAGITVSNTRVNGATSVGGSGHAFNQNFHNGPSGFPGIFFFSNTSNVTVAFSTITSANNVAVTVQLSSNIAITDSYLEGRSRVVEIQGSTNTVILNSAIHDAQVGESNSMLYAYQGSAGVTLATVTFSAAASLSAPAIEWPVGSKGLVISSVTIKAAPIGLQFSHQVGLPAATPIIDRLRFTNLLPGSTAMYFLGGVVTSTFTNVSFDNSAAVNVNGVSLTAGARITMGGASGPRAGPQFENDPQGVIDWQGFPSGPVTSVQSASLAPAFLNTTENDRPMLRLKLWNDWGARSLSTLRVNLLGDLPAGIVKARIWRDLNANDVLDTGSDVMIGESYFSAGVPNQAYVTLAQPIDTSTITLFVALTYTSVPGGKSAQVALFGPADFTSNTTFGPGLPAISQKAVVRVTLPANPASSYGTPFATPSSGGGFDTQLFLNKGQQFHVEAAGNWWNGTSTVTADGSATAGGLGGGLFIGQLAGRIGGGAWFGLGQTSTFTATQSGNLYLAMSATNYSVVTGALDVAYVVLPSTTPKRWVGGASGFPNAASVDANWSPASRPQFAEQAIFDNGAVNCDWDLPGINLASLTMTTSYVGVLRLQPNGAVRNSLRVSTDTVIRAGTLDLGWQELIVDGQLIVTSSATLDMGGGGSTLRVGTDLTISSGAFLRSQGAGAVTLDQAVGPPNWTFHIRNATVTVNNGGGFWINSRVLELEQAPKINAFDRVMVRGGDASLPSLMLHLSSAAVWTLNNWDFGSPIANVNVNSSDTIAGTTILFKDASGPKMGSTRELDPFNRVFWSPDGGGAPGTITGTLTYSGGQSPPFYIVASTVPGGLTGVTLSTGSGGVNPFTLSGLPTPATYYLTAWPTSYGNPPAANAPRGAYNNSGVSFPRISALVSDPVPVQSSQQVSIGALDFKVKDVSTLSGSWGIGTTQIGPIRFQAWHGGDPLIFSTATLENEVVVSPGTSVFNMYLPDAGDYTVIGFVDVDNDAFPDSFEARGSSANVLMNGAHTGVGITISGGTQAPGGMVNVATFNAHPGFVPLNGGWQGVLKLDLGAVTSSAAVNSLSVAFNGFVPAAGVSVALFEDVNNDGLVQPATPDVPVTFGNFNPIGGPGVVGTTMTFTAPQVIMAGTTRHYLVAVDLHGINQPPFSVFIASPTNFGMGAGFVNGQPIYPITSGLVQTRTSVFAMTTADQGGGGQWMNQAIFPGQSLVVLATGTWKRSAGDPGVGPGGQPGATGINTLQPSANHGALVGRIQQFDGRSSPWFLIGASTTTPITNGGWLYMAMNDLLGAFSDNQGALAVSYDVIGSTVGTLMGTVYYTGAETGNIQVQAISGPVTASVLIPLVGGTTYYPYQITQMQTSGGYDITAQVLNNPIQQARVNAPLSAGTTTTVDFNIPLATGTITGNLSYSGVMPFGTFVVAVATTPNFQNDVKLVGITTMSSAGAFTIPDLAVPGVYYAVGFRSATGGEGGPKHAEPFGYYGAPGAGVAQFGSALTPIVVTTASYGSVNFSIFDTGEIAGRVSLPAAPGGADVIVLAGRGVPGSPGFAFENEGRRFYQSAGPAQIDYSVDLLRPATNYSVYAFVDLNHDHVAGAGEPTFFSNTGLAVPQGGSLKLDFAMTAAAPPPAPTGFAAAPAASSIQFAWNTVPGAATYELRNATGGVVATLPDPTSYYVQPLGPNTSSQITLITATNGNGTSGSTSLTGGTVFTLAGVPLVPTITSVTQTTAQLSWSPNNPAGTLFELQRGTQPAGPFGGVAQTTSSSRLDGNLAGGKTYYYRVRAINGNGIPAAFTAAASTTTNSASGPSILGQASYAGSQAGVVRIEASTSASFFPITASVTMPPSNSQPYQLVVAGGSYFVRGFIDINGDGLLQPAEDRSPSISAVVAAAPVTGKDFAISVDTVPPAAPAGVAQTPGFKQVTLTWNAPNKNADNSTLNDLLGFIVERAGFPNGPFTQLTQNAISTTVFVDAAGPAGQVQYYRVLARDLGGNSSAPSGIISAIASPGGSISGNLTSYAAAGTGVFHVRLSTLSFPGAPYLQDSTLPSFTFSGLQDGVYYVTAFLDRNNDGVADPLTEAAGTYGGISRPYAVTIAGGNAVTGANVIVCDRTLINAGANLPGALSGGDCPARDKNVNSYTDLYAFVVGGGGAGSVGVNSEVNLRLGSGDFDGELILLGPDGNVLARDNRAGGAGLRLTLTQPGVYIVEPTTFLTGYTGNYNLSMSVTGGFSGAISGNVAYSGARPGPIFVQLLGSPDANAFPVRVSTYAAPGAFSIGGLPDGAYFIRAFRDANFNGARDAGEPTGVFGVSELSPSTITVTGGVASVQNAALTLTDPAAGAVAGSLFYDGAQPGPLRVEIGPLECESCGHMSSVLAFASTAAGNSYALPYIAPSTTYFIQAYVDSNGNGLADTLEPKASSSPVTVVAGSTTTISFVVRDPGFGASGNATIVGSITYHGSQAGHFFMGITKDPSFNSIDYVLSLSTSGPFLKTGIAGDTTYYIGAFLDVNGNSNLDNDLGEPSGMAEPEGWAGGDQPPIYVSLTGMTTANITLNDPPSGEIHGRVSYSGAAPLSQKLIVSAQFQGSSSGQGDYTHRQVAITRQGGVTQYDYVLPFLQASGPGANDTYSVLAWIDANGNQRADPGEALAYFIRPVCDGGGYCRSADVNVSTGPGSFPTYGVNVDVQDQGGSFGGSAASGELHGEVIYLGVQSGPVLVRVFDNENFAGAPLFVQSMPAPAGPVSVNFSVTNVPFGTYWLEAYRDTTGTGLFNPLFQGRVTMDSVEVSSANPRPRIDGPALSDPGGAGSVNIYSGDFVYPGGARFDGGSSDLGMSIAVDTVSVGGPFVFTAGVTTQDDGLEIWITKYSSTGVMQDYIQLGDTGSIPKLVFRDGYLWAATATTPFDGDTDGVLLQYDTDLYEISRNVIPGIHSAEAVEVRGGYAFVGAQDADPGSPDIVLKIDPTDGSTQGTGTYTFPGSLNTPHASALALDQNTGDVYAYLTTGGGGYGELAGIVKFGPSLGAPSIVKDVTAFQTRDAAFAVSPVTGDLYMAFIDKSAAVARLKRFSSNLVELGSVSTPVKLSPLVEMATLSIDDDGTVYLGAAGTSGSGDLMVVRYTPSLAQVASRTFDGLNGTQSDLGTAVAVHDSSNVFVMGTVANGRDLDWATLRFNMNSSGGTTAAGQVVTITTANAVSAIYGSMLYSGALASSGTFRASLLRYGSNVPVRIATAAFAGGRNYLFNNVSPNYYRVTTFLDLNGNQVPEAGEPVGDTGYDTSYFDGATIGGVDVTLCDRRQITSAHTFDSLLATDCETPDTQAHTRLYTFQGRRGQSVTIGVEALGFTDSYLILYGPDGSIVNYDDDSWGDGDAIIEDYALPADGLYTVAASAYYEDALGSFHLLFNGSAGTPGSISGAIDYTGSQGGQMVVGLFSSPSFSTSTAVGTQILTSTRAFSFQSLPSGTTYYLGAFVDVNFNKTPDAGEDHGVFGVNGVPSPILLESGQDVQARVLVAPSTASAAPGFVTGTVAYAGARTGPVRLEFWSSASFQGRPAAIRELAGGPGSYDVGVPGGVTYFIKAFLDANGDFLPQPDEPRGVYAPANQGAQSVFVPVGSSVSGVDLTLRDPGVNAAGGVAGEGAATIAPSTAVAGYQTFTATITFTVGAGGLQPGGSLGFGVPNGYAWPQFVTVASTHSADLSPVSYNGPSVFVTAINAFNAGEQISFAYQSPYAPCELSTRTFQVSSSRDPGTPRLPLVSGSPVVVTQTGGATFFQPVQGYIAVESGKRSEAQVLEARDNCGNRAGVAAPVTVSLDAKHYDDVLGFTADPLFGLSTGAAVSTTTAINLAFNTGESAKSFFALATSTGYKTIELGYDLGSGAQVNYISVTVLPANAISQVSVATTPAGVGASSTTITPNNDGNADQAFIRFTLADNYLPWHVLLSSSPIKAGVAPIWETWGYGQPARGSIAWDGRYSPWINGGQRVPNGTYYARIEAGGAGVFNDSLTIGVNVAQMSGRVLDAGLTPNPPLGSARIQLYGPSGFNQAASDDSGGYFVPGVSAGVYNLQINRDDFLSGGLRVTLTATGAVSTFTVLTNGSIGAAINAAGGLDIVMKRAPALVVVPPSALAVSTSSFDRWGSLQVRSSTSAASVPVTLYAPLRLPAGTTTFDDGSQWDQGTQQFVTRTSMKFNVPAGDYSVEARFEGFAPSTAAVTVGAAGATVQLPALAIKASISGTVSVASNPDPMGREVTISAVPLSTGAAVAGNSARVFLPTGSLAAPYQIFGIDAGAYVVRASAAGLVTSSTGPIVVAANAQAANVDPPTLTAGASISGTVNVLADLSNAGAFPPLQPGFAAFLRVSAWAPGTLSFGSTALYVPAVNTPAVAYQITGLNAGVKYQVYAELDTNSGFHFEKSPVMPTSALGGAVLNITVSPSTGVINGTVILPNGSVDFNNISISGVTLASDRPDDVGHTFTQDDLTTFPNFASVGSTATFKFTNQGTETLDVVFSYKTTGASVKRRVSTVSGSTTTVFIDLTGETWSIDGGVVNQVSNALFNSNPRVVANAQFYAPAGYPVNISSSAARVVAVKQNADTFGVSVSTSFDPLTSRVGFLTDSGTFTIRNVQAGVYYVRTVGLAPCATCEPVVPSVGKLVRVSTNVTGVSLTISDGYGVSGAFSLANGLQDSGDFIVSVLDRSQNVVRSTTVALGAAALGATANSASYAFANLPAGEFYALVVRGAGDAPRYVGRPLRFPDPSLSPTGLQASLSNQNVTLSRAAYVTGRLRDGGTGALVGAANADLLAPTFQITATANPWVEGGYAVAASSIAGRPILGDGTFRVGPLLPGVAYDVTFAQTGWDANFLARGSQNFTPKTISGVQPQEGESRDLGVVSLHQGMSIGGVVRQSTTTGQVLGGLKITAKASFGTSGVEAQTFTDGSGRYSIWVSSYVSSQFDVTAAPRDGNVATNGQVYGEVTVRNVTLQPQTTVDFFLTPLFGAVTGQVVVEDRVTGGELSYPFGDLKGFPAAAINLQKVGVVPTKNPLGDIEERTDASGKFDIRGLSTGTYTMRVTSLGYSVFNATVTTTGNGYQLYTGSNTPANYLPNNTVTLRRGATVTGRILKTDGSAPNSDEVASVAAANFAAGEFVVGAVDVDRVGRTVNSYSISGFKPGVSYDLVIIPSRKGSDVSFPPEGRGVNFSAAEATTTKNLNLTFIPTGIDCAATSKSLGANQFQVKINCTKALRNTQPSDSDLDLILALSTYTSGGAAIVPPNNAGQLLGGDKTVASDRRQITAIYRAGGAETQFFLRLRAAAADVDPTTGSNYQVDKVFDFYTGLESNVVTRISNMNGGSVELEPSAQDELLGLDERSRVNLRPGALAYGDDANPLASVIVASATIPVGLTKARDRQSASVLAVQRYGYVPAGMGLDTPIKSGSVPGELYSAMSTYRTQAGTTTIGGANPLSSFYNIFLPAGIRHQLQQAADITFSYDTSASSSATTDPNRINVWFYNAVLGRYVLESTNRRLDQVNKTITVEVNHFSVFVVLDSTPVIQAPNVVQTDEIQAVNFPNPADCITHANITRNAALFGAGGVVPSFQGTMIRYSLPAGSASEAKIRVYNMAGERVRTIEPGLLSGGITYYSPWNCANDDGKTVSSGVYIGEVEWNGKKKFFKIAIVKGSGL